MRRSVAARRGEASQDGRETREHRMKAMVTDRMDTEKTRRCRVRSASEPLSDGLL
jgi:hypothetical protein